MLRCLSGLGFGLVVEEMMSWWKAKKKRRLEAEFRRNTIRLHEGSKKHLQKRQRQENQSKSWHEGWGAPSNVQRLFFFLETKAEFSKVTAIWNLWLIFQFLKHFINILLNCFQTSIETGFFHITFWRNFNAAVWIKKKITEQNIRENVGMTVVCTFSNLCEL